MKIEFFTAKQTDGKTAIDGVTKTISRLVWLRLLCFLLLLVFSAAGWDYGFVFYTLAVVCLLAFLVLLELHRRHQHTLQRLTAEQRVLQQYIDRFSSAWQQSPETGSCYLREDFPQAKDLDLFGPASVYQYICAARTGPGRDKLAAALSPTPLAAADIRSRQEGTAEFIADPQLSLKIQTLLALLPPAHATVELAHELEKAPVLPQYFMKFTTCLFGALTWSCLLLAAGNELSWIWPAVGMFLQFTLAGLFYSRTASYLAPLNNLSRTLQPYQQIFYLLENSTFTSAHLKQLQLILRRNGGASRVIGHLSTVTACATMRSNLIFYVLANALFLWDFHCQLLFAYWRNREGQDISRWIDALAEVELLLSLAVIGQVKEEYCFPEILVEESPQLAAKDIKHVLLHEATAVANSLTAASQTCIITGSNMSGKTTFLRTLAASTILAYAGSPVCAKEFTLARMELFTSMRVQDDTAKGLSTFYAELLRIKTMVEYSHKALPQFVLIDEIFKGTNSADRIIGAREAIRKLTKPWCLTFVSTHDFELCDMAEKDGLPLVNYHFAEYYTADEIHFDYKLKSGRCESTNAKYLLKLAGIL